MGKSRFLFTTLILSIWVANAHGQLSKHLAASGTANIQPTPKQNNKRWATYCVMPIVLPSFMFFPTGISGGFGIGARYLLPNAKSQLIPSFNVDLGLALVPASRVGVSVEWRTFRSVKGNEWSARSWGLGLHTGFFYRLAGPYVGIFGTLGLKRALLFAEYDIIPGYIGASRFGLLYELLPTGAWDKNRSLFGGTTPRTTPKRDGTTPKRDKTTPKRDKKPDEESSGYLTAQFALPGIMFLPTGISAGFSGGTKLSMPNLKSQLIMGAHLDMAFSLAPGARAGASVEWRWFSEAKYDNSPKQSYGFGLHAGAYPALLFEVLLYKEVEFNHFQYGIFGTFGLSERVSVVVEYNISTMGPAGEEFGPWKYGGLSRMGVLVSLLEW